MSFDFIGKEWSSFKEKAKEKLHKAEAAIKSYERNPPPPGYRLNAFVHVLFLQMRCWLIVFHESLTTPTRVRCDFGPGRMSSFPPRRLP